MDEWVDRALRLLLEARAARRRRERVVAPAGLPESGDDWETMALAELADGILFVAKKNRLLQDEVRALRDEVRRLRARTPAA